MTMLDSYLAMLTATAQPMLLGAHEVTGSLVDYFTEQDPDRGKYDMRQFVPETTQRVIIGIDELPAAWGGFSGGQIVRAAEPLDVSIDGLIYKTRGVRMGYLMGQRAYIEIRLAEPQFSDYQTDEALHWETWTRRRFQPDGNTSPVTGQPTGTWPATEIQVSFVDSLGDGFIDLGKRTAEIVTRVGTLEKGDRLYDERGTFEVHDVKASGIYERSRIIR